MGGLVIGVLLMLMNVVLCEVIGFDYVIIYIWFRLVGVCWVFCLGVNMILLWDLVLEEGLLVCSWFG